MIKQVQSGKLKIPLESYLLLQPWSAHCYILDPGTQAFLSLKIHIAQILKVHGGNPTWATGGMWPVDALAPSEETHREGNFNFWWEEIPFSVCRSKSISLLAAFLTSHSLVKFCCSLHLAKICWFSPLPWVFPSSARCHYTNQWLNILLPLWLTPKQLLHFIALK